MRIKKILLAGFMVLAAVFAVPAQSISLPGTYYIESGYGAGLYLHANGDDATISTLTGNYSKWNATNVDGTYMRFDAVGNSNSNRRLHGYPTGTHDVSIGPTTWNGPNCQWRLIDAGNNQFRIQHKPTGLWLRYDGNTVHLAATSKTGEWTKWRFLTQAVSATPTPTPGSSSGGNARCVPYVDISLATGSQVAGNVASAGLPGITLAFLVDGGCTATWGGGLGNVSNATFPNGTTVKSQIVALNNAGRKVIISWGGALGSVLSSCGNASSAQAMYQSVFNAYPAIAGQDFDIEGGVNVTVLANALAGLKKANPNKIISLTLPVLPIGLVQAGLDIVNACHNAGFHPDCINVMAMDYGSYYDNGGNMLLSAKQAAQATRTQTGDPIGLTPMIGQNDTQGEIFTLANATDLVTWAKGQNYIVRLAFWSLSRDNGGCPGQTWASPTCSGVSQSTWQFSSIFKGF
ncbi:MAG: hypothetical protein JW969_02095 [Spirochaetales bacterium]|nr:hypothetical protein [Spirochaetales bacterium]